jgi:hypothetical protein
MMLDNVADVGAVAARAAAAVRTSGAENAAAGD